LAAKVASRSAMTCSKCERVCPSSAKLFVCGECRAYRLCLICQTDETNREQHLEEC
jgi:hypothetical protein